MAVPTDEEFWSKERPGLPDIGFLKDHFYREGRLSEEQALYILEKGTEILRTEPNLLEIGAPITGNEASKKKKNRENKVKSNVDVLLTLIDKKCVATFTVNTMT